MPALIVVPRWIRRCGLEQTRMARSIRSYPIVRCRRTHARKTYRVGPADRRVHDWQPGQPFVPDKECP